MQKSKPAVALIIATIIIFTSTVLFLILNTPKYNNINEVKAVTVISTTDTTENKDAVNINTANEEELTKLFGIGQKRAENIIEYREKNGRFRSIEELTNIHGINKSIIEKNSDIITF